MASAEGLDVLKSRFDRRPADGAFVQPVQPVQPVEGQAQGATDLTESRGEYVGPIQVVQPEAPVFVGG